MVQVLELQQPDWDEWVASRPSFIQEMCRCFPPDRLYRLDGTGSRVLIESYCEDGTLTVIVSGEFNACMFERKVFGVKPESLVECDLPEADEPLGALLTEEEDIELAIEEMRKTL